MALGNGGTLALDLPANYGENVYLYVHLNNGIRWYTTGEYEFVEWRYLDTILSDYMLIKTETGEYKLVDTVFGDYELVNTMYGDYKLVDTVYGHYQLIETKEISRKIVNDAYNAEFDLVIKNASGNPVYTGKIQNNGELSIPQLIPGKYTVTLSGDDIGAQTKYVEVVASKTAEVNLGEILTVIGEQVNKYLDVYLPVKTVPDVKLGNEYDPFDVNAIRLN